MIDLHCHLLPSIDDGSRSLEESLEMARLAVADGITISACTPHILPGVYHNRGDDIRKAVASLQSELKEAGIRLRLTTGADVHIAPDLVNGLKSGRVLSLGDTRYLLLEPPQSIVPPRFDEQIFKLVNAGYVPIVTHPERLAWPDSEYALFERIVRLGGWMQITAGSLTGRFGRRPRALAEQMLDDGIAHILATDAHNTESRPPKLSDAVSQIAMRWGKEEAMHLVSTRPAGILRNMEPDSLPPPTRCEAQGHRAGIRAARM